MLREHEYNLKAMGTECAIAIVTEHEDLAAQAGSYAMRRIQSFERRFSRFLPDSELSRLNANKEARVSKEFLAVTIRAQELSVRTGGIFNPLLQIQRLGYDKDFTAMDGKSSVGMHGPYDTDFSRVVIDPNQSSIKLHAGQCLDFGGFLKGYAAEQIADELQKRFRDIRGIIINLGGDICARGKDANNSPFVFCLFNPVLEDNATEVTLDNGCLATSGTYKRTWVNRTESVHHILDASGERSLVSPLVSASVLHADGACAEAYAKVLLAVGPEAFTNTLGEIVAFVAIDHQGAVYTNDI